MRSKRPIGSTELKIVPMSIKAANQWVAEKHRHNKPVPGSKFCLGVVDADNILRGVAIVGRPVARKVDDGCTLEVTRVVTDGWPNANSALYAAARRVAFEMGYTKVITYTLQSESGASLRGAGWKLIGETKMNQLGWLNREGRVEQGVYSESKRKWETSRDGNACIQV